MRKPELEPVIKTDTDTTPDIPADTGDSAASGGGHVVSDTSQDPLEEVEAEFLPQDAGGSGPQGEVQLTGDAGGGAAEGFQGGGAGEAPEPQEEEPEESSSPMEDLTETVQEYLQELDPQQVSDTMHSLLDELQQRDYSFLSDLPDAKLTPEQANQAVHDLLTELQKVDYQALTGELNTATTSQISEALADFYDGLAHGTPTTAPVESGNGLAALGVTGVSATVVESKFLTAEKIDKGFDLWETWEDINDVWDFEHLLPGKLADALIESTGLEAYIDKLFQSFPGAVKDGKEHPLSALGRNLAKYFLGDAISKQLGKMLRQVVRDLGVNPYVFSLRNLGTRAAIEAQKRATIFMAEHERDREIDAANDEVRQAEDEKQAALDAYDTEQTELDAAENTRQQSIRQAEAQESQALADNERIRNETIQKNNAAAEEAKTQIQNGDRPTAFQDDIAYQSQLQNSGKQCSREVENAQNINRAEVSNLERQKNEALQTQQSRDFTALNREKQSGSISAEDAQARQSAIERMEGQSYDSIRSQYDPQIRDSNTRYAQACEQANQNRITRDLQATDDARDRANQKAEVKKTLDDRHATSTANNAKADAESTHRDQCRAAHDKRAQADPVYHSCASKQEIESRADANIAQKQTAANTRITNAQQTCNQKRDQAETTAQQRHQRLDTELEKKDRDDIAKNGGSIAPATPSRTSAPSQGSAVAPSAPANTNAPSQGSAVAPAAPVNTVAHSQGSAVAPAAPANTVAPSQGSQMAPAAPANTVAHSQGTSIAPVPDSQSTGTTQINAPTHGPTGIVH